MHTYVAFLRGINVGGNTRMKMSDLVDICASLGFADVKTYLQSGNVVFKAPADDHATALEQAIEQRLGLKIRIMIKEKSELERVRDANPFANETIEEDRTLFVSFLFDELSPVVQNELRALSSPDELIEPRTSEIYTLLVRAHFPKSHMSKNTLLRKLKVEVARIALASKRAVDRVLHA